VQIQLKKPNPLKIVSKIEGFFISPNKRRAPKFLEKWYLQKKANLQSELKTLITHLNPY